MKRTIKNITIIVIILLGIGGLIFANMYCIDTSKGNVPPTMGDNNQNTPPEKPNGSNDMNNPPEKPDGEEDMNRNEMMEVPSGKNLENKTLFYVVVIVSSLVIAMGVSYLVMSSFNAKTFKDTFVNFDKAMIYILLSIIIASIISFSSINLSSNKNESQDNRQNEFNNGSISYSSTNEFTSDESINSKEFSSNSADENAVLISGNANIKMTDVTVNKTGDSSSGDNTSFYGINSAILAKDNVKIDIKNSNVTTEATGANGVFSYGKSTIDISNSNITTSKDSSGGIMVAGGGMINATDLTVKTSGISSAAIRSDKGGGTLNVIGGTYETNGAGSPSIYSTANITVKNALLTSNASEGIVIEGKNSVSLDNVVLTDTNDKLNGKSTTYKNIFLYQSMSGDADTGLSSFSSKNSKIITNKGDTFYITNTDANITLENNTIVNKDKTGNFLRVQKDSWGTSGSNGGNITLKLTHQSIEGNIVVDSISTLDISLDSSSSYEGVINSLDSAKSISLKLSKDSKIKLLGDSYLTSIDDEDSTYSNIDFNGFKLYVNGKSIN